MTDAGEKQPRNLKGSGKGKRVMGGGEAGKAEGGAGGSSDIKGVSAQSIHCPNRTEVSPAHSPQLIFNLTNRLTPLAQGNGASGSVDATGASIEHKDGVLPLELGDKVMCLWRDDKYHQVK
jgi:hypothetical protein